MRTAEHGSTRKRISAKTFNILFITQSPKAFYINDTDASAAQFSRDAIMRGRADYRGKLLRLRENSPRYCAGKSFLASCES
jgi:hypothetical protein